MITNLLATVVVMITTNWTDVYEPDFSGGFQYPPMYQSPTNYYYWIREPQAPSIAQNPIATHVTDNQRLKLLGLAAMRIWTLKSALAAMQRKQQTREGNMKGAKHD